MQGQETLVQHLKKSYSMSDLIEGGASTQHFTASTSASSNLGKTLQL